MVHNLRTETVMMAVEIKADDETIASVMKIEETPTDQLPALEIRT